MSFANPFLLAGLVLVPLLLVLYVRAERRRGRSSAAFSAPHLMDAVAPRRPRWRRHVPVAVLGLAVAALIVALARPQVTVAVPVEQATVVITTDRSGSMLAKDVAPSRLVAARRAAGAPPRSPRRTSWTPSRRGARAGAGTCRSPSWASRWPP